MNEIRVELLFERHNQAGELLKNDPLPSSELGMFRRDIDIAIAVRLETPFPSRKLGRATRNVNDIREVLPINRQPRIGPPSNGGSLLPK